jgi:L-fucose isomerase-like protein
MERSRLKIGYVPTRRDLFSINEAIRYKNIVAGEIKRPGLSIVDLESINSEGLLYAEEDLDSIITRLKQEKVDALFFPHCNFGTEDLVAKVAREMNVPVLIWGPRDDAPLENGIRTRDSQCGLFATGKVLRRFKVPFTYLNNCSPDSSYFKSGFDRFLSVSNVVRAFRKLRILQISTRPTGFWSVMVNENELLEKFGIQVYPVTLQEVTDRAEIIRKAKKESFIQVYQYIKSGINYSEAEDSVEKIAALKCAILEIAGEYKCSAAAIQCWTALQSIYGIMPCLANSLLADDGFPCACETDIHGAVSAVMIQAACMDEKPHFFGDVTVRHPDNPNAELLWHCGPFPHSLAKDPSAAWVGRHWILHDQKFGTCEWEIKGGDITIARFDGDGGNYSLLIGEGKGVDGPKTRGTYVWFEVDNWPKWERKIVKGPYIHHIAGIHDKVGDILLEACSYIPGLEPDPAGPSREVLEDRWIEGSRT